MNQHNGNSKLQIQIRDFRQRYHTEDELIDFIINSHKAAVRRELEELYQRCVWHGTEDYLNPNGACAECALKQKNNIVIGAALQQLTDKKLI